MTGQQKLHDELMGVLANAEEQGVRHKLVLTPQETAVLHGLMAIAMKNKELRDLEVPYETAKGIRAWCLRALNAMGMDEQRCVEYDRLQNGK